MLRYGKYFLITPKQVDAADRFFARYGGGVAFFGRFLPIVRTAVSVPCGLAKMSIVKFSLYTGLAMLPITALYVYIGLQLGEHWQDAAPLFNQYLKPVAFVIILLVVTFVIYKIINNSKKGIQSMVKKMQPFFT